MKLRIRRIVSADFQKAICELADISFPSHATNAELAEAYRKVMDVFDMYHTNKAALFMKYGTKVHGGAGTVISADKIEAYRSELAKVSEEEIEVSFTPVRLPETAIMSARSQVALDGFLIPIQPPPAPPPVLPPAPAP